MAAIMCPQGKLCLRCAETVRLTLVNGGVASVTETVSPTGVMSRGCARCRLLRHVQVSADGHWLWTGAFTTQFGRRTYGQSWLEGERMGAHRASYIVHKGPVPDGLDVLHSCDIKACVNPEHLRPGTHQENLAEAREKHDWSLRGEAHPRAQLTWDQVREIRDRAAKGEWSSTLAAEFGITQANAAQIIRGTRWADPEYVPPPSRYLAYRRRAA